MVQQRLIRFSPELYQHPSDRKALVALEKMPGLSFLLKKINEHGIDRILRIQTLGSEFKVTSRNFPKLSDILNDTCNILDINPVPELYLGAGAGRIITYVIGVEKPIIGINLEAMEWLTQEELYFLFGHELIKIKCQYINYQQIAYVMPMIKTLINNTTFGLGGIASNGLEVALQNWIVTSRFTSDRCGLLACQDLEVAIAFLMKLGGLPNEYLTLDTIDDFVEQSRSFMNNNLDTLDQVTKIFSFTEFRLPWTIMRMAELFKWVDSGEYESLLQTGKLPSETVSTTPTSELSDDSSEWDFLTSL